MTGIGGSQFSIKSNSKECQWEPGWVNGCVLGSCPKRRALAAVCSSGKMHEKCQAGNRVTIKLRRVF